MDSHHIRLAHCHGERSRSATTGSLTKLIPYLNVSIDFFSDALFQFFQLFLDEIRKLFYIVGAEIKFNPGGFIDLLDGFSITQL
jgi:hypothetical protein